LKCGNGGLQGEQRQKRFRNREFSARARGVEYRPVHNQIILSVTKASAVTVLLLARSDGDESALEQVLPVIEAELRRLAQPAFLVNGGGFGLSGRSSTKLWLLRKLSGDQS